MNHGTQPSPAESAAICGTEWPVFCALVGELRPSPGFAAAWSWLLPLLEPPFEPACEDPPPPELEEEPVGSELVVGVVVGAVDDELGATGMVDSAVPLELDVLGLPPPL